MQRQQIRALAILITVALVGLLVFLTIHSGAIPDKTVKISGITECSENIDGSIADHLGVTLYGYIDSANQYNQIASQRNYTGTVRPGSCSQQAGGTTTGANGVDIKIKTSSVIVDIPLAKQSWKFSYDWVQSGDAGQTDLGTLRPTCLPSDQLKYGDFNCTKVLNISKYGTPYYDPILQYMPYSGDGFDLDYSPRTKEVIATMTLPASEQGNAVLLQNDEAAVPYWFQSHGLNISNYKVTYTVEYQ